MKPYSIFSIGLGVVLWAISSTVLAQPSPSGASTGVVKPAPGTVVANFPRRITKLDLDPKSTSKSITILDRMLQKRLTVPPTTAKPANWPAGLPWEPRRFHGPFKKGSDFSEVKAVISGSAPGGNPLSWNLQIYFADFFAGVDAAYLPIYRRYLGATLPTTRPTITGNNYGTVFTLTEMRYSENFGGTFELVFEQSEDYGFEFAEGDGQSTIWDTEKGSLLKVYIPLNTGVFNTAGLAAMTNHAAHVALSAKNATKYVKSNNGWVPAVDQSGVETVLNSIASSISGTLGGLNRRNFSGFVYGFVLGQFLETF